MAFVSTREGAQPPASGAQGPANTTVPLVVVMSLFFVIGSITSLNDILIPHLKNIFSLSYAQAMLVQFFFFSAYFVFAYPSGWVAGRMGYKRTIVVGLVVVGCGALLFVPAASAASFGAFLAALAVLGAGFTFIQVSANPYVSALGRPDRAAARLNMAGMFNSTATMVAPAIGRLVILSAVPVAMVTFADKVREASSVKVPYICIALSLFVFAGLMASFKLPRIAGQEDGAKAIGSVWQQRHLLLGVIGIFMYVGVEVAVGSLLINFLELKQTMNMNQQSAAFWVPFYWGGLLVGRLVGATALRKAASNRVLTLAAITALALVTIAGLGGGLPAMAALILIGLCHSVMWPDIFTLAIRDLGPLTSRGSGLLIAGIIGGALIPLGQGWMADHIGLQHSFLLLIVPYIYIAFYGLSGYRVQPAA